MSEDYVYVFSTIVFGSDIYLILECCVFDLKINVSLKTLNMLLVIESAYSRMA